MDLGLSGYAASRTTITEALFDFAVNYPAEDIPDKVIEAAWMRTVDTIAAALASASLDIGMAATRAVLAEPTIGGRSSLWASDGAMLTSASKAAMANGMLAHGVDYDDTHSLALMHTGSVVVPTALAVGEEAGATGPQVLAAVAVGYEVANRLGSLASGEFQRRGFHPTSALGIFGATAAAARLKNVQASIGVHAAGLAGSMASGIMEYLADGSDAKQMHPGWAAHGAIMAIQFALHGAKGPTTVIEGRSGIFQAFINQKIEYTEAVSELGRRWDGVQVVTKPYPSCNSTHAAVDAWQLIRDTEGLAAADAMRIRRLTALVPKAYVPLVCEPIHQKRRPRTVYEARFSLPFVLACAVVDGQVTLDSFASRRLADDRLLRIAERVDYKVVEYAEYPCSAFPMGLQVEMEDDRIFEVHVRHNLGSIKNPLTEAAIWNKLLDAARRRGSEPAADDLLTALRRLPGCDSLKAFTKAIGRLGSSA